MAHSTYTPEATEEARKYIDGGYKERGEAIPKIESLALILGKSRPTIYKWAADYPEFGEQMQRLRDTQVCVLLDQGLLGNHNPVITKLILATNHGYSDRLAQDHTSSDKSMSPTRIELVAPGHVDSED